MHSLTSILSILAVIPCTLSAPSQFKARDGPTCDQYTPVQAGPYAVQNDAWGKDSGTGSQCAQIDGLDGGNLAWSTTFTWDGGPNSIKSYANVEAAANTPCKPLNQYHNIPTSWSWSMSTNIVGDVSYDAFLGDSSCGGPGDPHKYEVMVWLAKLGTLQPIGSSQQTVQIGGSTYDLWSGTNDQTGAMVFSFVAGSQVQDFNGDLMDFFNYLVQNNGVDPSLFLTSIQAGTEVATGDNVKFTTSKYTISST
ncbi:hypothetical protein ACLMJK_007572 [Lecanora helva]